MQTQKLSPSTGGFPAGATLAGQISHYRPKETIYAQGAPADTVLYVQKGFVRLSTQSGNRPPAVTAILAAGDLVGAQCLAGFPQRLSSAVALTETSLRAIPAPEMLRSLHKGNGVSTSLISYLLVNDKKGTDHMVDLLTFSADQRLARALLRLARMDGQGAPPLPKLPFLTHQTLAEMIGTTRSRVNFFMNRFRKLGYISYSGETLEVRKSLRKAVGRE